MEQRLRRSHRRGTKSASGRVVGWQGQRRSPSCLAAAGRVVGLQGRRRQKERRTARSHPSSAIVHARRAARKSATANRGRSKSRLTSEPSVVFTGSEATADRSAEEHSGHRSNRGEARPPVASRRGQTAVAGSCFLRFAFIPISSWRITARDRPMNVCIIPDDKHQARPGVKFLGLTDHGAARWSLRIRSGSSEMAAETSDHGALYSIQAGMGRLIPSSRSGDGVCLI
ncbi:hypothetical protein BDA96_05G142800 [Sorghum bicolor]|uniref:Uncharacterized protein n=2 Tax=Sorghum bicolor TaxID=4558 RepID=A0A921UGQ9_SORBI|nr:hypothetical protein BDA96_05G142800 [Sorghum bicolor]OQU83519.1 hypothetical protein SORBI_3005G130001 [Sorghum bicolor]